MRPLTTPLYTLAALLLIACPTADAQQGSYWTIGLRSFGPLQYGMTLSEARSASGMRLRDPGVGSYDGECAGVEIAQQRADLLFTWDGRWILRTVTVSDPDVYGSPRYPSRARPQTRSGIGIGSTASTIRQAYPGQIIQRAYSVEDSDEDWLVYTPRDSEDSAFRVVFKMHNGVVGEVMAGYNQWISSGGDACL